MQSDFDPDSPVASEIEPEVWPTAADAAGMDMGADIFSDIWAFCSASPFLELGGPPQVAGWPSASIETLEDEAPFDVFNMAAFPDLVPDDLKDAAPFDVFNLEKFPDLIPDDLDDGSAPQSDAFSNPADCIAAPEGTHVAAPSALLPLSPSKMAPGVGGDPYGCSAKLMTAHGQDLAVDPDMDLWDQLMHGSPCSQQTHEILPGSDQEPPVATTQPNANGFGMHSAHDDGWHGSERATQQAWRLAKYPLHGSGGTLQ